MTKKSPKKKPPKIPHPEQARQLKAMRNRWGMTVDVFSRKMGIPMGKYLKAEHGLVDVSQLL